MRIGVLTSGGDAPGMNATIRAVVRTAISQGAEVVGIKKGYLGLMEGYMEEMQLGSVGGIINLGGTILGTTRAEEFKEKENQERAVENLKRAGIDALVIIGGNGTLKGAIALHKAWGVPVVQIASTIDNDVPGVDPTIGFDTAVNTALGIIDKIRDTASSYERIFVVEVMGRDRGFIALEVGLAGGAEFIIIPEMEFKAEELIERIKEGKRRGKRSCLVVVAEGAGKAEEIARLIWERTGLETRSSVVGYAQRGGSPSARDRVLGSLLGFQAAKMVLEGKFGYLLGMKREEVVVHRLEELEGLEKEIDLTRFQIARILSL